MSQKMYFTKEHEWIRVEGDEAVVGITDHAQAELGDIVFVELPEIDDTFESGMEIGSVESVKAVSELFSPVDLKVLEVNEALEDAPDLVNHSAQDEGWMVRIALLDPSQLDLLMNEEQYASFVEEESN